MNFSYISAEDWKAFREKHFSAAVFLETASLRGEKRALLAELKHASGKRRVWIESRLADFDRTNEAFSSLPPL